ncbi:hypothetical protein DFH28DRAFT_1106392 [Melampsora americana]|nr:hypothetical protein DFH28DRAFT_1106392 [Melampsora americana]
MTLTISKKYDQPTRHRTNTLASLMIRVSAMLHESIDQGFLDPKQVVEASDFEADIGGLIAPVDEHLLQQDHLNTWRDLRTIEVAVKKNKCSWVFGKKLENVVNGIFENLNLLPKELDQIHKNAASWVKHKQKKPLLITVYYLTEVLKHHSSQKTNKEIQNLTERLIEILNDFPNSNEPRMVREIVTPFLDSVMKELGLELLLETFGKSMISNHSPSLYPGETLDWKKIIVQEDQLEYAKHYHAYMNLIEVFDILAATGVQDRELICDNLTPSLSSSLPKVRQLLEDKATNPQHIHRYLINKTPYDHNRPLYFPIFGYPAEIEGKSSGPLEIDIHQIWSQSGEEDLEISSRLSNLSNKIAHQPEKLPRKVSNMTGYKILMETAQSGDLRDVQMLNHISRTIKLVVELEEQDSEAQRVLWSILQSALRTLPLRSDQRQSEKRIENSDFKSIRRDYQEKFGLNLPNVEDMKAKFMMYYWTLVSFVTSGNNLRHDSTVEWMEFGLGRVYLNHLESSVILNKLYEKMSLISEKGKTMNLSNSIRLDKPNPTEDEIHPRSVDSQNKSLKIYLKYPQGNQKNHLSEEELISVKSRNEPVENLRKNPQRSTRPHVYLGDDEDDWMNNFAEVAYNQAVVQENKPSANIKDKLNFKIPKRKSSRYSSLPSKEILSDEVMKISSDKRMNDEIQQARDLLGPFHKRPRTTTYKIVLPDIPVGFVSKENKKTNTPKFDQIQTSKDHQHESVEEEEGRQQDLFQITGSEPESSDSLSPIVRGLKKDVLQTSQRNHHFDLNDPMEDTSDSSVPDLNDVWEPLLSNNNLHKAVFSPSEFEPTSIPQVRRNDQETGPMLTSTGNTLSHDTINIEQVPDLNFPMQISPEQL